MIYIPSCKKLLSTKYSHDLTCTAARFCAGSLILTGTFFLRDQQAQAPDRKGPAKLITEPNTSNIQPSIPNYHPNKRLQLAAFLCFWLCMSRVP